MFRDGAPCWARTQKVAADNDAQGDAGVVEGSRVRRRIVEPVLRLRGHGKAADLELFVVGRGRGCRAAVEPLLVERLGAGKFSPD